MTTLTRPSLRIALVEDDAVHRDIAQKMLLADSSAHEMVFFRDAASAITGLEKDADFDCALLDINLPGMSGIELSKVIAARYPIMPIVFITSEESQEIALQTLALGAEDYLVKNEFNQKMLVRSIHYAIERRKAKLDNIKLHLEVEHGKRLLQQQKDFVALVGHEFRTPLAIISSSAQLIARKLSNEDAPLKKNIDKIEQSIIRLSRLIDQALKFSALEESQIMAAPEPTNVGDILHMLVEEYRGLYPTIEFHCTLEPSPTAFHTDGILLEQIVNNVLSNAAKYSAAENGKVHITQTIHNGSLQIIITDNGRGVPEQELSKLAEKFYRASNSIDISGSGIGLYLSYRFLEMLGGSLQIENRPEGGMQVMIIIPNSLISQ